MRRINLLSNTLLRRHPNPTLIRLFPLGAQLLFHHNPTPETTTPKGMATFRPIAEIVEELNAIEAEARETDKALRRILKPLGV